MCISRLVGSDSLRPHGLYRLLCPRDSPGKNTEVGCHALLQGTFPTQGSNLGLLPCRQILYWPSHQGAFSSIQLLICVCLFETPWTAAHQASLSITNSLNLLKLMAIESVMPSNHLILSSPSPPAFNLSQRQGLFQCSLHQVAKVLISSCIVSGCFCITVVELSHCNEDYKA